MMDCGHVDVVLQIWRAHVAITLLHSVTKDCIVDIPTSRQMHSEILYNSYQTTSLVTSLFQLSATYVLINIPVMSECIM
jgi:hypothetical protein